MKPTTWYGVAAGIILCGLICLPCAADTLTTTPGAGLTTPASSLTTHGCMPPGTAQPNSGMFNGTLQDGTRPDMMYPDGLNLTPPSGLRPNMTPPDGMNWTPPNDSNWTPPLGMKNNWTPPDGMNWTPLDGDMINRTPPGDFVPNGTHPGIPPVNQTEPQGFLSGLNRFMNLLFTWGITCNERIHLSICQPVTL
jgi:hypothetical protein